MPPGLGLILFGGLGYILIYASVANRGRFATSPWAGLQEDAYTGKRSPALEPDAGVPPPAQATLTKTPGAFVSSGGTHSHRRRRVAGVTV